MPHLSRIDRRADVTIVTFPADVDSANAYPIGEQVLVGVASECQAVILDLTATRYLDSAGIDMVFRLHDRLVARRQRLHAVVPDGAPLMRVIEIAAVADVVPVHPDLESALNAARGAEGQPVGAG